MSVRIKDFWELEAVPKLFEEKFTKSLGHEIDGLIFQPVEGVNNLSKSLLNLLIAGVYSRAV